MQVEILKKSKRELIANKRWYASNSKDVIKAIGNEKSKEMAFMTQKLVKEISKVNCANPNLLGTAPLTVEENVVALNCISVARDLNKFWNLVKSNIEQSRAVADG